MSDDPKKCPCGSDLDLEACCGPIIAGTPAPTAEALMRARYTAYARGDIDFVVESHHSTARKDVDRDETEKWSKDNRWLGLKIVATEKGGPDDDVGVVEFVARFQDKTGRENAHHERSDFKKEDGKWFFVDGKMVKPTPIVRGEKVGRNDPCSCGSGKKYKRCHGA